MKRLVLAVLGISAALAVLLLPAVGGAAGSPSMTPVTRAPRVPSGSQDVGAVAAAKTQTGAVVLKPRDQGALTRFIAAATDPSSSQFHHYLPRGQFRSRFGPTQATINAVKSQLQQDGLQVTGVASDGLMVDFTASANTVERAFHTGLERLKLPNGSAGQATTGAVQLPSNIADSVSGVVGLNTLAHPAPLGLVHRKSLATHASATAAPAFAHPTGSPAACPAAQNAAEKLGGLTDDAIANSYGAFGLYGAGDLGAGQHIAVYELEPFAKSDLRTFDKCYFGAMAATQMAQRLHVIPVDGGQPAGPGSGEAILDVEDVSAMAPGADIDVYEAPNDTDDNAGFAPLDAYAAIVNSDQDQVVTTSWGLCEQAVQAGTPGVQQAENFLFEQAAAQGQSIFSAAGDEGSDDCDTFEAPSPVAGQNPVSVDDPTSQPYVIGAGGTTIDDATQPAQERVWNDGANGGATGGGISMSWAMPSWQRDARIAGEALPGGSAYTQANTVEQQFGFPQNFCQGSVTGATSTTPCRLVPDVAADADEFTGAITIFSSQFAGTSFAFNGGWTTIGGTSSAAPLWAGLLAEINASATCASNAVTTNGVGFASPLLYAVASNPSDYKSSFNDITAGNNDIFTLDSGKVFPATAGYDLTTGLGTPMLTAPGGKDGLAFFLCSLAQKAGRPGVTGLAPAVLSTAGGSVTITGSGFENASGPDVAGIEVGDAEIGPADFTVNSKTSITAKFPPAANTLPPGSPKPQDGSGPAPVVVTVKDGESSAPGAASTLQYVDESASSALPSVTGISPYGGPETSPTPVTILGSGFEGTKKVTFGGVAASSFKVVSDFQIKAVPAAFSSATQCAPSVAGETPTTDICQVQVRVTNATGTSALGKILQPLEGALPAFDAMAVFELPPGCKCEQQPAPTEFDYVPAPKVTSISTSPADPSSLASENGDSVITIKGRGFNILTLDWVDFGDPTLASSQNFDETFETGTEIQIVAPAESLTTGPQTIPLSVKTLAGQSAPASVTYAGVPEVTSALNTATNRNGAAATGGAPMAIGGQGFEQAVGPLQFNDTQDSSVFTSQFTYTVASDSRINTTAPASNAGLDDVEVCSVTGCAANPPADEFFLYPPGNPKVDSISPASGPAAGGTAVAIKGENLGCVTGVFFGNAAAEKFSNAKAVLDCGSTDLIHAKSTSGVAGQAVKVRVTTVESDFTGSGKSPSTATFTYTP
jgi:Pro-kumamolisin, activation domain/Subtilase family/IPT/TIG domain